MEKVLVAHITHMNLIPLPSSADLYLCILLWRANVQYPAPSDRIMRFDYRPTDKKKINMYVFVFSKLKMNISIFLAWKEQFCF